MTTTGPYKGRLVLLQLGTTSPVSVLTAKTNSFTINHSVVDVTTKKTNGWGAILNGGGITDLKVTLDGIMENETYDATLRASAVSGSSNGYTLVTGNGDKFVGNLVITSYTVGAAYNDSETYQIALQNDGEITFTPAV
jgi:predicted secreted protein